MNYRQYFVLFIKLFYTCRILQIGGENLVLLDTQVDATRIVVLASKAGLQALAKAELVLGDGTFDVTPEGMCQLYTMHVGVMTIAPAIFALLSTKTKRTYVTVLECEFSSFVTQ